MTKKYYREVVHTNEARCLKCMEVIRSMGGHNMVGCKCGNLHVDGGSSYLRRSFRDGMDSWEELSEVEQVEREPYDWEIDMEKEMTENIKSWTVTILEDPDDPDGCILPLPDDLLRQEGWVEGDTLNWEVQDDGSVIISKK